MNRGVEIASEVADGPYSVILEQVANGVAVRMAVLYLLAGGARWIDGMKLLLKGGRVVDPANGRDGVFDVLIDGDRIARVGRDLPADGATVVEVPSGLRRRARADRHARAPARAGAGAQGDGRDRHRRGGRRRLHRRRLHAEHRRRSTTTPASPSYILAKAAEANLARVYPIGAVSRGQKGEQLADIAELKQAGCVALTDDGRPVATALLMRRALEYAGMFGMPVIEHCEEQTLKGDGVAHEGLSRLGARPARHSRRGRVDHGARDIALAELTGGAVHIAHMSARQTLRRGARRQGARRRASPAR